MAWTDTLKKLAPTVASALGGPLAGTAVAALTSIMGGGSAEDIRKVMESGQMTAEQITKIRELEMQFQDNERERGFRYAELEFKDRDSARKANVDSGMQKHIFWLGIIILATCLGTEIWVLVNGIPEATADVVAGRVLGLLDALAIGVFTYWYGTSSSSARKTDMLQQGGK
jgi:hypothetical protein